MQSKEEEPLMLVHFGLEAKVHEVRIIRPRERRSVRLDLPLCDRHAQTPEVIHIKTARQLHWAFRHRTPINHRNPRVDGCTSRDASAEEKGE